MGGTDGATGLGLRYLGFDEKRVQGIFKTVGKSDCWATIQIDQPESSPYLFFETTLPFEARLPLP
jgi:hypothetical protein